MNCHESVLKVLYTMLHNEQPLLSIDWLFKSGDVKKCCNQQLDIGYVTEAS